MPTKTGHPTASLFQPDPSPTSTDSMHPPFFWRTASATIRSSTGKSSGRPPITQQMAGAQEAILGQSSAHSWRLKICGRHFFQAKERMRMFPKIMVKIIQYPCKSIVNYGIFYVVTAFFVPRFSWIRMNLWLFMCKKQASIIGPWLSNKSGSIWKLIPLYLAVTAHLEYIMTHSICSLTLHDDSVTSLLSLR